MAEEILVVPSLGGADNALLRDGTVQLTADWDAGPFQIRAETFYADAPPGVAPLVVDSNTRVANLNADLLDGLHGAEYVRGEAIRLSGARAATTANVTLAGVQTIDGVSLQAGDRVLVRAQTNGVENGLYEIGTDSANTWIRTDDMAAGDAVAGHLVLVKEGATYADQLFVCTNNAGSDVVGTDALSFFQLSGGGGSGTLGNLTDVQISNVTENEVLAWDAASGVWTNQTAAEAQLAAAAHTHDTSDLTSGVLPLARGGLGSDASAWSGLIRIEAGAAQQVRSEFARTTAPTASDDSNAGYSVGSLWIDTAADKVYMCVDATAGAAVWRLLSITQLDDVPDVTITAVTDNEGLHWDAASGAWINQTQAEAGWSGGGGSGDVSGPASSTDNGIAKFDGTTGKVLQSSAVTIDDGTDKIHTKATAGAIQTDADAATITFDMDVADVHQVTLGGDRTLAVTNVSVGQRFLIRVTQDSTGGRTVTWWSGIRWPGGSVPNLSTGANKTDVFGFLCTGADSYDGFVLGQNL